MSREMIVCRCYRLSDLTREGLIVDAADLSGCQVSKKNTAANSQSQEYDILLEAVLDQGWSKTWTYCDEN
jgi:hypothetical protein